MRAPSFKGLKAASPLASKIKSRNSSRNTKAELALARALRKRGVSFRRHVAKLPGCPDFVLLGRNTAVFCDGDFWHGRNWPALRKKLLHGSNAGYWTRKILANRRRDLATNRALREGGWSVLRLWETDVLKDPDAQVNAIEKHLRTVRRAENAKSPSRIQRA